MSAARRALRPAAVALAFGAALAVPAGPAQAVYAPDEALAPEVVVLAPDGNLPNFQTTGVGPCRLVLRMPTNVVYNPAVSATATESGKMTVTAQNCVSTKSSVTARVSISDTSPGRLTYGVTRSSTGNPTATASAVIGVPYGATTRPYGVVRIQTAYDAPGLNQSGCVQDNYEITAGGSAVPLPSTACGV